MPAKKRPALPIIEPNLQISFYHRLQSLRGLYLQEALSKTVTSMDVKDIDRELALYVQASALRTVASFGVRGEVFFPVPCLIQANPFLLGYYRLLLGLSQKELYNKAGLGRFKRLEEHGDIPKSLTKELPKLCACLVGAAEKLVDGIDEVSVSIAHDLQLLTLGPQLRGSENTRLGQGATQEFFDLMQSLVKGYVRETTVRTMVIQNDSRRRILVEFSSDPDVRITQTSRTQARPIVSIEIKGGTDISNIHNRLGEAEKSHQKARNRGFYQFWTILRCEVDPDVARRESPTTTYFFHLDRIRDTRTGEHKEFREQLGHSLGIKA